MRIGFIFPGQGSQSVGMLGDLAAVQPEVQATFEEAGEALGQDLWRIVSQGPAELLNQTLYTQPAMLAAGVAVWRAWRARGGPRPACMAGHSLGEYTALVCAGALAFADAVPLVQARARCMQEAVPEGSGAMAAILGLDDEAVRRVCETAAGGEVLEPVNFNAPGQVVIAGQAEAVRRGVEAAKAAGAKRAVMLAVSVPSHCALMRPAAERFAEILAAVPLRLPEVPVLHNVNVETAPTVEALRQALVAQLHSPVRWVETIHAMTARGVDKLVECGPGKVLAGLNRRIDKTLAVWPVFDPAGLETALAELGQGGDEA